VSSLSLSLPLSSGRSARRWPWPFLTVSCRGLQVPVDTVGHRPVQGGGARRRQG
jgi:hypothetical protein